MRLGLAGAISGPGLALLAGVMAPPHNSNHVVSRVWPIMVVLRPIKLAAWHAVSHSKAAGHERWSSLLYWSQYQPLRNSTIAVMLIALYLWGTWSQVYISDVGVYSSA